MDPINVFCRAVDQTGRIVAGVKPDQFADGTPCTDWDVRGLLDHTIAAVRMFDTAARGGEFDGSIFAEDNVGDDPTAAYDARAAALSDALGKAGVLDAMWHMPFGTVPGPVAVGFATLEIAQHGWDLARATGQHPDFDAQVTEAAFATARQAGDQVRVPGVFGPETTCAPNAPDADRLAAFVGRNVST